MIHRLQYYLWCVPKQLTAFILRANFLGRDSIFPGLISNYHGLGRHSRPRSLGFAIIITFQLNFNVEGPQFLSKSRFHVSVRPISIDIPRRVNCELCVSVRFLIQILILPLQTGFHFGMTVQFSLNLSISVRWYVCNSRILDLFQIRYTKCKVKIDMSKWNRNI